jgi:hypothetical protein
MSRTTTNDLLYYNSSKRCLEQSSSCGTRDTSNKRAIKEALLVNDVTKQLFASNNQEIDVLSRHTSSSSNNRIVAKPIEDSVPTTMLIVSLANGINFRTPLKVLFDSGSTSNFIYQHHLPRACKTTSIGAIDISVLQGSVSVDQSVSLTDVVLAEFSHNHHIDEIKCYVAPGNSNYDMIVGRKTMRQLGIKNDFDLDWQCIQWMNKVVPMKPPLSTGRMQRFREVQQQFLSTFDQVEEDLSPLGTETNLFTSVKILQSRYDQHVVDEVADKLQGPGMATVDH